MGHIVVKNLRKEYIERRKLNRSQECPYVPCGEVNVVFEDINLEFQEGEMVCILGPSGCGKTTMLRIIAGFDKPTAGNVIVNGKEITGPSPDHIFVFQHSALLPWMTVWENVELGVRHVRDKAEREEKIEEFIEMVELEGFEDNYPYQLSGGMQRRAELARALVAEPETLFMDEPFSGLDFLTHMKMREEVVNMHEFFEKTTIIVTHDIDDALIMGDRITLLGGRPAQVKMSRKLDFPRPRDFTADEELTELRHEIFLALGVNYAL
ncbi:ABC transporter ATP-binding protein [Desulfobacterales bacterium HSG2]|nr:ABC transporter ATP-binding protein [Desulfobacterales bacterium HSG2]